MFSSKLVAGGLAAIVLTLGAGAALAAPGRATTTVNVRSGPGTSYGVVGSLVPGERVDIQKCTAGWCYVGRPGTDGWVSDSYLERTATGPIYVAPQVVIRPHVVIRPPVHHRPPPHHHRPPIKPRPPGWHKPKPPANICVVNPNSPLCHKPGRPGKPGRP